jgi:lipoyl(octanoyl) transferase
MDKSNLEWKSSTAPVAYLESLGFMETRVDAIAHGQADECIWLLEHPPLYTGGTSAKPSDLLNPRFPVFETGRGGEYTYHGPGQRVGYVMLNLKSRQSEPDLKKYVWQLGEWIIRTLDKLGVKGERREGRIGIWVAHDNTESKIAAIGVRVRHWITFHGISINVDPDLSHYAGIVPCGIGDYGVTSLSALGKRASMADLDAALMAAFVDVFGAAA